MPCGSYVDPVAMKFKADFGVTAWDEEGLEFCRNRKVEALVHLMQRSAKLQCSFRADFTVDLYGNDFIQADFVLKRGADRVGCYVENLIASPDDAAAIACQQKIAIGVERAGGHTDVVAAKPSRLQRVNDLKDAGMRLARLCFWLGVADTHIEDLHI